MELAYKSYRLLRRQMEGIEDLVDIRVRDLRRGRNGDQVEALTDEIHLLINECVSYSG